MGRRVTWAVLAACAMVGVEVAGAQGDTGNTPIVPADNGAGHLSPQAAAALARTVTLRLDRVPLDRALAAVASAAHVVLSYSPSQVPEGKLVSLAADRMPVGAALDVLLSGTGMVVDVSSDGRIRLWPRAGNARAGVQQGTATITGHVTDGALKTPLSEVSVRVEGTALRTTANADGKYTITGVVPGTYRITARRVGYQALTKEITIAGDQAATLDFALVAAPTRLDEVVTTAVGEQRRYEVGTDISTINADSIAPTAPITSLTDLISARAPGVTVLETSGMTGSGEAIRIEGLTSLVLQNDPILIVDGVRQDNSAGGMVGYP